jgi:hypothetical protein
MRGGLSAGHSTINLDAMVKASFIVRGVYTKGQGGFNNVFIRNGGFERTSKAVLQGEDLSTAELIQAACRASVARIEPATVTYSL